MLAMVGPDLNLKVVVRCGEALLLQTMPSYYTAACLATGRDGTVTIISVSDGYVVEKIVVSQEEETIVLGGSRVCFLLCSMCELITKDKFNMRRHLKTHMEESNLAYKCDKCSEVFGNKFEFKQHTQLCTYRCNKCDFTNNRKERVEKHIRAMHKFDHLFNE